MTSVVVGIPVRNGERWLAEALDSLLSQTPPPAGVVVVDDSSSDGTPAILRRYVEAGRIVSVRSEERLGLVDAWRRAYAEARKHRPAAPYFAWGSDHDLWQPGWLESLAAELDAHPDALLAYPHVQRIGEEGEQLRTPARPFDTVGVTDPLRRLRLTAHGMRAGDMVYGLHRVEALERVGWLSADAPTGPAPARSAGARGPVRPGRSGALVAALPQGRQADALATA